MIKSVTIINHLGESLTMDMMFPEKSGFIIRSIDGLGPPKADINMEDMANADGSSYNSARATKRNIVFNLEFLENPSIEITRQNSYKFFPIKRRIGIFIETDTRVAGTYGYVESNEPDIFNKKEGSTISVLCGDSYLYSQVGAITNFSAVTGQFQFPFSNESATEKLIKFGLIEINSAKTVYYTGDSPVGVVIFMHAIGPATNVEIINLRSSESMKIDTNRLAALTGFGILEGDDIIISTVIGDKYVRLLRDGEYYNILNALDKDADWFQIEKGNNPFVYTAETGSTNLQFRFENRVAYEGV
jgi:hypothetical protein